MIISRIGPCRVFRQESRGPSARRRLSSEVRRRALRRSSAPAWFSSRLSEISRCTICARFPSPISRVSRWDFSVSTCPTSPLFRWRWRSYPPMFPGDDPRIPVTTGRLFATDIARVPVPKLGSSFQACVIGKSVWRSGRPAPPRRPRPPCPRMNRSFAAWWPEAARRMADLRNWRDLDSKSRTLAIGASRPQRTAPRKECGHLLHDANACCSTLGPNWPNALTRVHPRPTKRDQNSNVYQNVNHVEPGGHVPSESQEGCT